jgi:hypothetical protein
VLAGRVPTASGFHRHRSVDAPRAAPALEGVVDAARRAGAEPLVHCCAPEVPFGLLDKVGAPGLGVDLDLTGATAYDALASALELGRPVHLGVVPTTRPDAVPTASAVAARVERFLDTVGLGPDAGPVLTPACGLAGADPAWARDALLLVRDAARVFG